MLTPATFILFEQFDDFFRQRYFANDSSELIDDMLSLMFDDPSEPTHEEINDVVKFLEMSIELNVKFKKNETPKRKKLYLERDVQRALKNKKNLTLLSIENEHIKSISGQIEDSIPFCMIVLRNIILLYNASLCIEGDSVLDWNWRAASTKFYHRFVGRLFDQNNDLKTRLMSENFILGIEIPILRIGDKDRNVTVLSLSHFDNPRELLIGPNYRVYRNIALFDEPNTPWQIKFRDISSYQ